MCIRDRPEPLGRDTPQVFGKSGDGVGGRHHSVIAFGPSDPVSYTHLRAHETVLDIVCRLLLEKKKQTHHTTSCRHRLMTHKEYITVSRAV